MASETLEEAITMRCFLRIQCGMILVLFLCGWSTEDVAARITPNWTYEDLFSKSDLVIIATPLSTKDCGEENDATNLWKVKFMAVNTDFKIEHKIKGGEKNEKIVLAYYRLPESITVKNGPSLAHFALAERTDASSTEKKGSGKNEYLLFLRKSKESTYEPVSGMIDSALSIRALTR
jgi:hypothetical protein